MKSVCVCGDYKPRITHGCYKGDRVVVCKSCGRHEPDYDRHVFEICEDSFIHPKQSRYSDNTGDDWIDECARTLTPEQFRGAMMFTIGKYIRRMGRKDDILKEVTKIADYSNRWMEYEREISK